MADVRSMLKASRDSRKITHPHASYTSHGKLLCNLCEVPIKTEAAWQSHLHSSGHTLRVTRAHEAAGASKKRKASMLESSTSPVADERKRARAVEDVAVVEQPLAEPEPRDVSVAAQSTDERNGDEDEARHAAELAALDKELAEMEAAMPTQPPAPTAPTISAPAVSAEELAARAREEQSTQRGRRDAELEAEREDAARIMEEELDEQEGLDQRVKKLRERREALKKGEGGDDTKDDRAGGEEEESRPPAQADASALPSDGQDEDEIEDEDEDEDFDDWNFGRT